MAKKQNYSQLDQRFTSKFVQESKKVYHSEQKLAERFLKVVQAYLILHVTHIFGNSKMGTSIIGTVRRCNNFVPISEVPLYMYVL